MVSFRCRDRDSIDGRYPEEHLLAGGFEAQLSFFAVVLKDDRTKTDTTTSELLA